MSRDGVDRTANSERRLDLKFHSIHGKNISREQNGHRVTRKSSFCDGIAFSNRPISIDERVTIRQTQVSISWSGVLRFGVTSIDPASHRSLELPRFACPTLAELPGYWIRALPERYVSEGGLVQFSVSRRGDINYSINGSKKGVFLSGISTDVPLWVILDVYGMAKTVEFESHPDSPPDEPIHSVQRLFASSLRVDSPRPSVSLEPSRRALSIFGFSMGGARTVEPVSAPTQMIHGGSRSNRIPAPPRIPVPATPVARPRPLISSPPLTRRLPATNVGDRSRDEIGPAPRVAALPIRVTPPSSSPRRPTLTSSLGRQLEASTTTARVLSTSRGDDSTIYRRIGQMSETAMRLAREWSEAVESAVVPTSPRVVAPSTATPSQAASSSTTRSQMTSPIARGAMAESAGYLRLRQMTSSSTVRSPVVAFSSQMTSSSSMVMLKTPITRRSTHNQTTSSTRTKQSPSSSRDVSLHNEDCSICMEAPVNAVIYTCGHMCMCYGCALKIKESGGGCPICRKPMKDVIKTYKS